MIRMNKNYNKDFVFGITLTELIIMLFFLLLLLTAIITLDKNNQIFDLIKKENQQKNEIDKLTIQNNKQEDKISQLEKKNIIQKDVAIQIANELLNYKMPKKSKTNSETIKSIFKELVNQKELLLENALLKQKLKSQDLQASIEKLNSELEQEIKSKTLLLKDLNDINTSKELMSLIITLEATKNENFKLKNEIVSETKKNIELAQKNEELEKIINTKNSIKKELEINIELLKELKKIDSKEKIDSFIQKCLEFKSNENYMDLTRELEYKSDILQGQVKYLTRRLNMNGGNELPPCWADANGKPEYIFQVFINEQDLYIKPSWPESRTDDTKAFRNINLLINKNISLNDFMTLSQEIYSHSVKNECKYFVQLYDRAVSKNGYKNKRLRIESYFYKYENK